LTVSPFSKYFFDIPRVFFLAFNERETTQIKKKGLNSKPKIVNNVTIPK
jgi:hypothetical protein